jgi:LPS sulfotransferase NodH
MGLGLRDLLFDSGKRFYCICFSCRSGSTFLANDLVHCGLGEPFEHFQEPRLPKDRPLARTIRDIVEASDDRVFGFKIALNQIYSLTERLRREGDLSVTSDLRTIFPGLRFVNVRRTDKVAQAVSYWRAVMTDQWHVEARAPFSLDRPEYDFDAIKETLLAVVTEDWLWDRYFAANRIECHHVVYEDYLQTRAATLATILDFLAVPNPPVIPLVEVTHVMRDDWTQRVVERVRDDLAAQAFRGLQRGDLVSGGPADGSRSLSNFPGLEFLGPRSRPEGDELTGIDRTAEAG